MVPQRTLSSHTNYNNGQTRYCHTLKKLFAPMDCLHEDALIAASKTIKLRNSCLLRKELRDSFTAGKSVPGLSSAVAGLNLARFQLRF